MSHKAVDGLVLVLMFFLGSFNPETSTIDLHPEAQPGDEDLLNAAAIQTLLNGGTVYAVEPEKVPDEAPLAAVFRY
jgi:hypothetical protein